MRNGIRTADYHRAKTLKERLYYGAGIPSTAWAPPATKPPKFKMFNVTDSPVSPKTQDEWFDRVWKGEMFSLPYLILLASDHDDDRAVSYGYDLMKIALDKGFRIHVTESSRVPEDVCKEEQVFMLINLHEDATPERVQMVRDWAYRHEADFRIVCAAGDPAVLTKKLRLKFNAIFYMDSKIVSEKTFA